ncbi:hypothetical protein [Pseudoalteromonas ruthenica]|uniref:hypothetical protein n=1 Tax=Pseudoalteromonas ruthenica TaxID=151081 RepID=UPI0003B4A390|nr:hypothetical protein [Pseudoalteromonas ruthenica]
MESSSLVKDYNPVTPAAFARGYIVYCSFGHPHLVCRPEHIPDDPMLPHPIYAFRSGRVFAEQFLHDLDPWRNSQFIISTLFDYLHITSFGSGYKPVTSLLNEVAEALVDERLVMFELWDIAEHPNVVKQQLQKSDKTRSSDAAGSSAPKRSSGADLASPEKKAPAASSTSSAPVVTGAGKKTDTSKASEPQASEASTKKAPAQKKAPPQSMEECVQRLADARKRLEETGEYQPKYSQSELEALAAKGVVKERFIVTLQEKKGPNDKLGFERESGRTTTWTTTFDQMENADTDPKLLNDLNGMNWKEDAEWEVIIVDQEKYLENEDSYTFVPTYDRMKDVGVKEFSNKNLSEKNEHSPEKLKEVMTPEYSKEYSKIMDDFEKAKFNQYKKQHVKAFSNNYFKDKNEKEKFLCRHEYTCEIGTNKWFSGDGLTKTNGNSGYVPANQHGTLESITLERSPKTIAELEDPSLGAITRVPAKPIKG